MNDKLKKVSLRIVFFINIICLLLLLLSDVAPFVDPADWWMISLTGLFFPLLLLATLAFSFFWVFFNRKKMLLSFVVIILSIPGIYRSFAFNFSSSFDNKKESGNIRIVTWNVGLMNFTANTPAIAMQKNGEIFKQLRDLNADIVCLQEFFTSIIPGNLYHLMDSVSNSLGYTYRYFSYDYPYFEGHIYTGSIIFSKYKIIDSTKTTFAKPFAGSIIKAGILINNDTIDVCTTRLQSVHFGSDEYRALHNLKKGSDSGLIGSKGLVRKLKYGYKQRTEQIKIAKQMIGENKHPLIFTGDLNDVPTGYTYAQIKNGMTDAWIRKGFGLGRTFRFLSPTLRIDYIFFNRFLKCMQTTRIISNGSDHYGLVTDLQIKKEAK